MLLLIHSLKAGIKVGRLVADNKQLDLYRIVILNIYERIELHFTSSEDDFLNYF